MKKYSRPIAFVGALIALIVFEPMVRSAESAPVKTVAGEVFDVKDVDRAPKGTRSGPPRYPTEERRNGLSGEAVIEFTVDVEGKVRDAWIFSETGRAFGDAALETVKTWKYKAGEKGGQKVNTRMRTPITFKINQ